MATGDDCCLRQRTADCTLLCLHEVSASNDSPLVAVLVHGHSPRLGADLHRRLHEPDVPQGLPSCRRRVQQQHEGEGDPSYCCATAATHACVGVNGVELFTSSEGGHGKGSGGRTEPPDGHCQIPLGHSHCSNNLEYFFLKARLVDGNLISYTLCISHLSAYERIEFCQYFRPLGVYCLQVVPTRVVYRYGFFTRKGMCTLIVLYVLMLWTFCSMNGKLEESLRIEVNSYNDMMEVLFQKCRS